MINTSHISWDIKVPFIHYTEPGAKNERVVFGQPSDDLEYHYDDRLASENYQKWKSSHQVDEISKNTPRYWQEVLRKFCDDSGLELGCIITAVNQGNGFQYLVFGCKRTNVLP